MNRIASVGLFVIDTGVNIAMEIRKKCYAVCRLLFFSLFSFLLFFRFPSFTPLLHSFGAAVCGV